MCYLLELVFQTCEMYVVQRTFFFVFVFPCVFKHSFFTCVSYFQRWTFTALRRRTEAAPLFGLLMFGHRVYIVISVCLTQTLLKSPLCFQGSESEKNWVYSVLVKLLKLTLI